MDDPDGLLAAGGDLSPARLLAAYSNGIFPWYSDDQPILWWSPNPRCVFNVGEVHVSRSFRRWLKQQSSLFTITFNRAFRSVMEQCAAPRRIDQKAVYDSDGTWITDDMLDAYCHCHQLGHAHSVEIWHQNELVGGLYGLSIGQAFFAESMFSTTTNASKLALLALDRHLLHWGYQLIDAQLPSEHLFSLGATEMNRTTYLTTITQLVTLPVNPTWLFVPTLLA